MGIGEQNKTDVNFWSNLTAERIYTSTDRAKDACDRLQKLIGWVFGIYSTITFASVIWGKKEDWNVFALLFMGASFAILIFSYWESAKASFPEKTTVLTGNQASEQKAYEDIIEKFTTHFKLAMRLCFFGISSYCIGLIIQFSMPSVEKVFAKKDPGKKKSDTLEVMYHVFPEKKTIGLYITSRKNSMVLINIETDTVINGKKVTRNAFGINDGTCTGKVVFIDSSLNTSINMKYSPRSNLYIRAERADTIRGNYIRRTILRKCFLQVAKASENLKK
ncbi:hypothetical protein [Pedobacter sp. R-06]|uniref:hypothetical protein n=1 Tax=Pedobacter sp. R-06 TaxID=3404051 RepID=UPI003CF4F385